MGMRSCRLNPGMASEKKKKQTTSQKPMETGDNEYVNERARSLLEKWLFARLGCRKRSYKLSSSERDILEM